MKFILLLSLALMSCSTDLTGDKGDPGPAGETGPRGPQGDLAIASGQGLTFKMLILEHTQTGWMGQDSVGIDSVATQTTTTGFDQIGVGLGTCTRLISYQLTHNLNPARVMVMPTFSANFVALEIDPTFGTAPPVLPDTARIWLEIKCIN